MNLHESVVSRFLTLSHLLQLLERCLPLESTLIHFSLTVKVKVTLRLTVSQSVSLDVEPHLGLMTRYLFLFDSYGLVPVGRPLWREDESVFYICYWPLPAQSFSSPSSLGFTTTFYCLRFETSLFFASYDSQGHGGGIRPRLHTIIKKSPLQSMIKRNRFASKDSIVPTKKY
jgi:hypothetical protein